MFKTVVGHSNDPHSLSAVEEVLQQCAKFLVGDISKTGIIFSAIEFEHSLILQQIFQPEVLRDSVQILLFSDTIFNVVLGHSD